MGVFDQNSLKFNDAIPNPSKEDGFDIISCDNIECSFRDNRGYCLYETCMIEVSNIKYHTSFKHNCEICHKEFTNEYISNIPNSSISDHICPQCLQAIRNIICPDF